VSDFYKVVHSIPVQIQNFKGNKIFKSNEKARISEINVFSKSCIEKNFKMESSTRNVSPSSHSASIIISQQIKSTSILDIPLSKGKNQVSLSAFSFLYSEIVQRTEQSTSDYETFVEKLSSLGRHIGIRVLELLIYRESGSKREIDRISMLQFITKVVWKSLFGRQIAPDGLLKVTEDEFRIVEPEPITNIYVSSKKGTATTMINVAAFIGGIIEGILTSGGFVSFSIFSFFLKDFFLACWSNGCISK
jgi:hypothetical protein